jgi:hypothetical protein
MADGKIFIKLIYVRISVREKSHAKKEKVLTGEVNTLKNN